MAGGTEVLPPEEAYGRVTDPGRFAGLHAVGRDLLDELESRFAVTRETFSEPDRHGAELALAVRLVPANPAAAPLTLIFTGFPGLEVRMGRGDWMPLPGCGCDACDETVEECTEQLRDQVDALIAGTFGERLIREHGWWHERWYRSAEGAAGSSRGRVDRDQLAALRAAMPDGELHWEPWPERSSPKQPVQRSRESRARSQALSAQLGWGA